MKPPNLRICPPNCFPALLVAFVTPEVAVQKCKCLVLCACRQLVFPLLKWFQVSVDKHAQLGELLVNDSLSLSDYQSALLEERHSQQDRDWGTSPDNWWVC